MKKLVLYTIICFFFTFSVSKADEIQGAKTAKKSLTLIDVVELALKKVHDNLT